MPPLHTLTLPTLGSTTTTNQKETTLDPAPQTSCAPSHGVGGLRRLHHWQKVEPGALGQKAAPPSETSKGNPWSRGRRAESTQTSTCSRPRCCYFCCCPYHAPHLKQRRHCLLLSMPQSSTSPCGLRPSALLMEPSTKWAGFGAALKSGKAPWARPTPPRAPPPRAIALPMSQWSFFRCFHHRAPQWLERAAPARAPGCGSSGGRLVRLERPGGCPRAAP